MNPIYIIPLLFKLFVYKIFDFIIIIFIIFIDITVNYKKKKLIKFS